MAQPLQKPFEGLGVPHRAPALEKRRSFGSLATGGPGVICWPFSMSAPNDRQPWPMKWIVVAILLLIVPYTIITLRYRKEGKAFEPYVDLKERANVSRLLAAGFQRVPIVAARPADGPRAPGGADVTSAAGGIPDALRSTLVDTPLLPVEITSVAAAPTGNSFQPYLIQIACTLPDDHQQLGGADLYIRGEELVLAPTFEQVALATRSRSAAVLLTVPPGTIKPGRYRLTLLAQQASRTWPLEMR
jgi:hypothetical protein